MRVSYQELYDALVKALMTTPIEVGRARLCARLIAETTRDGVYSHGLNLFPRLMKMIGSGVVDVRAGALRVSGHGGLERWDGCRGIGNLNAYACMEAAIGLSRTHGIGCVALANTNHWMRGGTYGWQAADARVIGLCWTNTLPNLPPWGATVPRVGNNPLVIAVPAAKGSDAHIVLDMAMSQFSYGALASYRRRQELLPVPGGFDASGELTRDPGAIETSRRPLPIGFWKGSGLSIVLDMMAAVLANGRATHEIPANPEQESGLSQVFIAIDVSSMNGASAARIVDGIVEHLDARYPGERTLETRRRNLANGIPVEPSDWEWLQSV
jgi:3-dehydro-L-gulonate 2-dehydrogenase